MESTGVYWIPPYEFLEEAGFEVLLVNARFFKAVPGRKTDVQDCQWIQQLHSYGLLRGSFRPEMDILNLDLTSGSVVVCLNQLGLKFNSCTKL